MASGATRILRRPRKSRSLKDPAPLFNAAVALNESSARR